MRVTPNGKNGPDTIVYTSRAPNFAQLLTEKYSEEVSTDTEEPLADIEDSTDNLNEDSAADLDVLKGSRVDPHLRIH